MSEPTSLAEQLQAEADRMAERAAQLPDGWRQRETDAQRQALADQHATRMRRWRQMVGARFADADVTDLDLPDRIARWDGTSNVLLLGNVGTGKTHMACALARTRYEQGEDVLVTSVPMLLDRMLPSHEDTAARAEAVDVDLLVLDDLGAEKPSEWTAKEISLIVDERYRHCRPTIATSNLSPESFQTHVGERVWSRLYQDAIRWQMGGADRRRAA